jgi:hypothetical protein
MNIICGRDMINEYSCAFISKFIDLLLLKNDVLRRIGLIEEVPSVLSVSIIV